MKLFSWNVNGVRAVLKKGALQDFLTKYDPDILCLQETKTQNPESTIDLAQYIENWNFATKAGYAGTAIFSKYQPLNVVSDFPEDMATIYDFSDKYGNTAHEGRMLTAEFDKFYLVTVYTPNTKPDLSRVPMRYNVWDRAFLEYVQQLEKHKPVIFCGDLNVAHTEDDLARPKENRGKNGFTDEERAGIQRYVDHGFIDTFRMFHEGNGHYSWFSHFGHARERNVGWRIDYIFASEALRNTIKSASIHPDIMGSDHCPVSIELMV